MSWILIEILMPLVLFILIVWWTMPSKRHRDHDEEGK